MTPANLPQHTGNWLALLSATFACFIIVTGEFLAIGVLNNIAEDFNVSIGTAGLTVTVTSVAGMVSALVIPIYAKTLDRRYVLLFLVFLMMIANTITAFSPDFNLVLLGRFALGIALGGFWGVAAGLIPRLAPSHLSTATALTIFFSAVTLVTVLGVPLGSWLADHYGWRTPYKVLVILGGIIFAVQCIALPSLKPTSTLQWKELLLMPAHPIARKGLILFTLVFLAHFSVYNYFTAFFKQSAEFTENQISSLLLVFGVASVIGNILAGYLGRYNIRYSFALIALLLTVTFLALATINLVLITVILCVFIWGIGAGMVPTSINIWMHIYVPHLTEKGSALITFMFLILITIGSLVGGFIMDYFNGTTLMASMFTIALLALLLIFTMVRGLSNCTGETCHYSH